MPSETTQTSLSLAFAFLPIRSLKHPTTTFEMVELNARQETSMSLPRKQARQTSKADAGILDEKILLLVFKSTNWNPFLLCRAACVCKKWSAIAKRLLWKEFCFSRAPKMVSDLVAGCRCKNGSDRLEGGWHTLARLMFFCGGCQATTNFRIKATSPGHFIRTSRFSKTSGRSFLPPVCRGDTLYVTDPCEHVIGQSEEDVGIFRGQEFGV
ncbi:EID1-like F-box protein 3 isoform X2 [Cryptomeria japonica]|uniref:EID1-like F-box protein 3 isoform X2 n=1 Tax=Cryptomeria japonica TaxID=3369 RepID=UPI0027DA28BC|nr:EID1-like F-box protein 3 isoform X2 [Cryptomeria japonica]